MGHFRKHRFEALSDGVFAIAMTLLVLDLKVPDELASGQLPHALARQTHGFISFTVTFGIASVFWVFQHKLFDLMSAMSHATLLPTFAFLGLVSLLPFSTSMWGHHIAERTAFVVYFGNQFLIALALLSKYGIARRERLIVPSMESALMGVRIGFVTGIMGAAVLAAALVPLQYVWVVPLALGIAGRRVRDRIKRRYETAAA